MKIKLTTIYVDDQEKALHFYTGVLGFVKKADFSQGALNVDLSRYGPRANTPRPFG